MIDESDNLITYIMRLKRKKTGNIYKIVNEKGVRYFQYFYTDQNYLSGDLIWVFKMEKDTDDLVEIINSGYNFCFYTTINEGVSLKKWSLLGNTEIPIEMQYYPEFRWRDLESGDWFILKYDLKTSIGKILDTIYSKVQPVSFQFPWLAVEFMFMDKRSFLEKITDFETENHIKNGDFNTFND